MFCRICGKEINDQAVICPNCGCETGKKTVVTKEADAPSTGFGVLGYFFPLIGLILYLVWKSDYPLRAKSTGKGALIGVIVSVTITVLSYVFIGALIGGVYGGYYY